MNFGARLSRDAIVGTARKMQNDVRWPRHEVYRKWYLLEVIAQDALYDAVLDTAKGAA
jgi:hypothetical protein